MIAMIRLLLLTCCVVARCAIATDFDLVEIPDTDEYCLTAQRIVARTEQPVEVVIHENFDDFVMSKAIIPDGAESIPQIQQLNWTDASGRVVGISCKLKSADHLNLVYGAETAGPDGLCQDMNRAVHGRIAEQTATPHFTTVLFDPLESVINEAEPGMTGPDWLRPYRAMYSDEAGELLIRAHGFRVDFSDPQFANVPARFRGVHYCHFIAPGHLRAVLSGDADPETEIGQTVDISGYSPPES